MWFKRTALLFIFILAGTFFPLTASAQNTGPVYIVQSGDTLYLIAQRFGTSVEAIVSINNITDPSVIDVGSELIMPGFDNVSGILDFHELEYGAAIASLQAQYGLPQDGIIKLNRILHPGRLYVGQPIIITKPAEEAPLPTKEVVLAQEGESKIAFALRHGISPWDVMKLDNSLDRGWIIQNETLVIPGTEDLRHGLPKPIENVMVKPQRATQGQTLKIAVSTNGSNLITGQFGDWHLNFNQYEDQQLIALQGILALTEPGMYDLEIQVWDSEAEDIIFSFQQPVRIASGGYNYDPVLYVPEETIDTEKTELENELIASIIHQVTDEKYWEGTFLYPSGYTDAFPSYFGSRRNYNNQGYNWYHTGLDLYGGTGTPITAPAKGIVVFADNLEVRGNVTFIDHGWGVFTGYLHQSEIAVEVGDWVEPGQHIGLIGATGRVTGPHLHWEIWVGGNPVDPLEWTSTVFP